MIHLSYEKVNRNALGQLNAKAKDQSRAIDMYEAFGWEVTATTPTVVDGVTLSLKRDRKLKHKQELTKLERQAEDTFDRNFAC